MKKIITCITLLIVTTVISGCSEKAKSQNQDFNFVSYDGKENTVVVWFNIDDENYIPADSKTFGAAITDNFTMADKPAISVIAEAKEEGGDKKASISMTFNKSAFKEGAVLKSIKSFSEYKKIVIDGEVTYNDESYNCSMYDTFNDTYLEAKIISITAGVATVEYQGKLYNNTTDKKSIFINGKTKIKI